MRALASAGAAFLLAVLWFDLMFDVQVRGHQATELPLDVRESIATYYRRVTTDARPMNRFVAAAMLTTVVAIVLELIRGDLSRWRAILSLVLAVGAIGLAGARTVRNAVQLGARAGDSVHQSSLARSVLRDHVMCAAAIVSVLLLQLLPD